MASSQGERLYISCPRAWRLRRRSRAAPTLAQFDRMCSSGYPQHNSARHLSISEAHVLNIKVKGSLTLMWPPTDPKGMSRMTYTSPTVREYCLAATSAGSSLLPLMPMCTSWSWIWPEVRGSMYHGRNHRMEFSVKKTLPAHRSIIGEIIYFRTFWSINTLNYGGGD